MICALGKTSHRMRSTNRTASCVTRTKIWSRRLRCNQLRYCGLALASVAELAFDMDFELLHNALKYPLNSGAVRAENGFGRSPSDVAKRIECSDFTLPGRRDRTMTLSDILIASPM